MNMALLDGARSRMNRREFAGLGLAAAGAASLRAQTNSPTRIDDALRAGRERRNIPAVVAMVADGNSTLYSGAFGSRDAASKLPVNEKSLFSIMSMTKAITTTAVMQLIEQGKLKLDDPAARVLPELAKVQVISGFDDATGNPILRPAKTTITLRHLLTHTSGFSYDTWNEKLYRYAQKTKTLNSDSITYPPSPLVFEPGTGWQYGTSIDWAGRMLNVVTGKSLEQYFQENILQPLGMRDTSYFIPPEKFERLVGSYTRNPDGTMAPWNRVPPTPPRMPTGGGGLYSTAADYIRFTQMILGKGSLRLESGGSVRILKPETVEQMSRNQIGALGAGKMRSFDHTDSADVDLHPGVEDKWGFGFLINTVAYDGGRSAGSLAWAGSKNTFYWIDPRRNLAAVLLMHFVPFVDPAAMGMLADFERAVYANIR
jgi:methyl acetate hydrolase